MTDHLTAEFEVIRVQTMASGAIRYTLETAESEVDLMRDIVECQVRGILLHATMIPFRPSSGNLEENDRANDRKTYI